MVVMGRYPDVIQGYWNYKVSKIRKLQGDIGNYQRFY